MRIPGEIGTFKKPTVLGKMTMKTMGIVPAKCNERRFNGGPAPLARIYGNADSLKPYTMDDGTKTFAILGRFEAIDSETGEVFRSGRVFLPEGPHEQVVDAVNALPDDPGASVSFGYEIRSVQASNPGGYSYQCRPMMDYTNDDVLGDLRAELGDAVTKGLPAPALKQLAAPVPVVNGKAETKQAAGKKA